MKFLNRLAAISFCFVISLNCVSFAENTVPDEIPLIPLEVLEIQEVQEQTQVLDLSGYSISLPANWKIEDDKSGISDVKFFNSNGIKIGAAKLVNNPSQNSDGDMDDVFVSIVEQMCQEDITKYNAQRLEYLGFNAFPYVYVIYFNREYVSTDQIKNINNSFKSPIEVKNIPPKNISAMSYEEMQEKATYFIKKDNKSIGYNVDKLDKFIENQQNGFPDSLNVLKIYESENGDRIIKEWNYITYDGEKAYQFGYYQTDYDQFTYDNIPSEFEYIVKKDYGDTIDYRIFNGDIANSLLQISEFGD